MTSVVSSNLTHILAVSHAYPKLGNLGELPVPSQPCTQGIGNKTVAARLLSKSGVLGGRLELGQKVLLQTQ